MHARSVAAVLTYLLLFTSGAIANAQTGGSVGWSTGTGAQGYTYPGYTTPPVMAPPPESRSNKSTDLEVGTLYGMSAAYGAAVGIWIDAEAGIKDPGLQFIAPVLLGVAGPVGVYFLDDYYSHMPRGMPASIATGIFLGAGEGFNIWGYQFAATKSENSWGARGLTRAMALGGGIGGGAGFALAYFQEPSPKTSVFMGSAAIWGSTVGSMIGYGATKKGIGYERANDGGALGNLIGYNVGMLAAAGLSAVYIPEWYSIGWMWIGAGAGAVVGIPFYLLYTGSDSPTKRGLVLHGAFVALGIAAGGVFSSVLADTYAESTTDSGPKFAEITGFGLMPVSGGMGLQLVGSLF